MKALITGVNGQDGSYLSELLVQQGFEVHGTIRRSSTPNLWRLEGIAGLRLHYADLTDASSIDRMVHEVKPDYIFNLGAMSDVRVSFDVPLYAAQTDAMGPLALFEAARKHAPEARIYQAGSSEMHGMNPEVPCDETSRFYPGSPYAAAKVMAYHAAVNYREAFNMHISNGILYNHESERRGVEFVTRKIAIAVAEIAMGRREKLELGSLESQRDWGYAPEYVEAMYLMTQEDEPGDYVIATGETHDVGEFAMAAFDYVGLDYQDWVDYDVNKLLRPTDPPVLLGNATKAWRELGWRPRVRFQGLVERMVEAELRRHA